jgi:hypothetical protein
LGAVAAALTLPAGAVAADGSGEAQERIRDSASERTAQGQARDRRRQ